MKILILIAGDLASGKSTLANSLSEKTRIVSLKKDIVKEIFCDVVSYTNREENKKLSIAAIKQMFYVFEEFAKLDKDLILEANFHTGELLELSSLANKYGYNVTLILLTGDKDILFKRFVNRVPTRHKAHMSMRLNESFDAFSKYIDSLREEDYLFEQNIINVTGLSKEEVLNFALNILKNKGVL